MSDNHNTKWPSDIMIGGRELSVNETYELARMTTDEAFYAYDMRTRKEAEDAILRAKSLIRYWDKVMV